MDISQPVLEKDSTLASTDWDNFVSDVEKEGSSKSGRLSTINNQDSVP